MGGNYCIRPFLISASLAHPLLCLSNLSSWGSQGKNTEVVCHSLLQWTTFCQTSPPWPAHLGWPHRAWLSFIELDKAVAHVIRLTSFLWLWFVCLPSDASCNSWGRKESDTTELNWTEFVFECATFLIVLLLLLLSHFSRVGLCVTPWTATHQAPLSLRFSRQEHWSGLPFPYPMHESEKSKWSCSVVSDS